MYSAHMLEFICSKLSSNSSSEQADSVAGGLAMPSGWPKETPRWPTKSGWPLDSEPGWFWAILIYRVRPTLSRSLLQKFPVKRFLTARVHINLDTRPLKTSLVTLPPFQTESRRGPNRNLAWRNCVSTTGAKLRCGPRRGDRVTKLVFKGRVSRLMCTRAVRNLLTGNFSSKLRL